MVDERDVAQGVCRSVDKGSGKEQGMTVAKQRALFCWSGGKDSALCLHRVLTSGQFEVDALLTTLNGHYRRVSMHGVREELLDAQAQSIGLPLEKMFVSQRSSNEESWQHDAGDSAALQSARRRTRHLR